MQVRHVKTLMPAQAGPVARTQASAWSPNNKRLAFVNGHRVNLFDETGTLRDQFLTRAVERGQQRNEEDASYMIRGVAFSPNSSKLALAQSDCVVYVYNLGLEWGDKKSICNKLQVASPVTCVCWSTQLVFGTQDGKVRVGILLSGQRSQILYTHDRESPVVSMSCSADGDHVISGHLDGAILQFTFATGGGEAQGSMKRLCQHSCTPYSLVWGFEHIAAAGQDCTVTFYDHRAGDHQTQTFDYSQAKDREVTSISFNATGQTLIVALCDELRLFHFNLLSRKWEESECVVTPTTTHNDSHGSISTLLWNRDGSRFVTGTLTGAVEMFDMAGFTVVDSTAAGACSSVGVETLEGAIDGAIGATGNCNNNINSGLASSSSTSEGQPWSVPMPAVADDEQRKTSVVVTPAESLKLMEAEMKQEVDDMQVYIKRLISRSAALSTSVTNAQEQAASLNELVNEIRSGHDHLTLEVEQLRAELAKKVEENNFLNRIVKALNINLNDFKDLLAEERLQGSRTC